MKNPEELYFVYVCIKNPTKSKQKDDKKNRLLQQKEGKKALAKKMRDQRQKHAEFGHLAKTPTRDAFGNPRTSDRRIKREPILDEFGNEIEVPEDGGEVIEGGEGGEGGEG